MPSANINQIRSKVDQYLTDIESDGLDRFFGPSEGSNYSSLEKVYRELGIMGGSVIPWNPPGFIRMSPPGSGGSLNADTAIQAARREAFKKDNRRNSHLAVYVYATNGGPWRAVIDLEPDPVLPDVPPEISDIWIFTEARNENEFAVWRASVSSPWRKIETVVL